MKHIDWTDTWAENKATGVVYIVNGGIENARRFLSALGESADEWELIEMREV